IGGPGFTPVLTSVTSTAIAGTINVLALKATTLRVEFFATPDTGPTSRDEGKTFLGAVDVTTNVATGTANFNFSPPGGGPAGQIITATATDAPTGTTSTFSAPFIAPGGGTPALPTLSIDDVTITEGNTGTVAAVFTLSLSAASADPV